MRWVEDTLIKDSVFALPGRKALLKSDVEYKVLLIDTSETPIERLKKSQGKKKVKNRNNRQKHFYSGKKKRHQGVLVAV